jgi:molybdenum cofactor biosynthesis protein B
VITVSDTRTGETDTGGRMIREMLAEQNHAVSGHIIIPDAPESVKNTLVSEIPAETGAVILTGGTGIARRDTTIDTVRPMLDMELPGFGELFRALSYEDIGPAAMLSRALAGAMNGRAVFCLPGSTGAVKLAMEKLILPELSHIVWEINEH